MDQMTVETHLKSEMLCRGVVLSGNGEVADEFHSRGEFIHGTVFLLEGGSIVNTAVWSQEQAEKVRQRCGATLPTMKNNNQQWIITGQAGQMSGSILTLGNASAAGLQNRPLGDWFSIHSPSTLFCAPVRQCIYIAIGKPCRFCTFEGGKVERLTPEEFGLGLQHLVERRPMITSVAIGGGTPELSDMGTRYFASLAREATAKGLSSSVEMVPPPDRDCLKTLVNAGVASLIMSLEAWDEQHRAEWCLGKAGVSRSQYVERWREAVDLFGRGNVSSVLLVGAEPMDSTFEGAKCLIELGVIPTLIPLRWYPNSRFEFSDWSPVDPVEYLSLGYKVGQLLTRAGLAASKQLGCTACGGCSLETAVEKLTGAQGSLRNSGEDRWPGRV
jgi:hypothetical protein